MSAHLEVSSLHIEEGIAIFTHQHPASRNAMSEALRKDYMRMLEQVRANRQIRV
jgi:2-(1,2-epoxy-1,2-dihydrophenyl)acetyl-CoA isomerase